MTYSDKLKDTRTNFDGNDILGPTSLHHHHCPPGGDGPGCRGHQTDSEKGDSASTIRVELNFFFFLLFFELTPRNPNWGSATASAMPESKMNAVFILNGRSE